MTNQLEEYEYILKKFMNEMNQQNGTGQNFESIEAPEVNWSLSELEGVVYDFINYHPK